MLFASSAGVSPRVYCGFGGYVLAMSRPIIICTISAGPRDPCVNVSICRPLRNTEQVSASVSISCIRWLM